jgi:hypothetical protein
MIHIASLVAILLLTGIAWAMGFRSTPVLDAASAVREAEGRLAGFRAAEAVPAAGGRGAVLRGVDGSLALLLPFGDGWLARRLSDPAHVRVDGGVLEATLGEPMLRVARLPLERVPAWLSVAA